MTIVWSMAGLILGVYFSTRCIAAWYRLLDLWYAISLHWPRVLSGILLWNGVALVIAVALPAGLRLWFLVGLAGYLGFYLVAGLAIVMAIRRAARAAEAELLAPSVAPLRSE